MTREIIVIRPIIPNDIVTQITYEEAQEIIDYARSRGWKVIDIAKEKATREEVEKILRDNPKAITCHYDHGTEDSWICSNGKPCIDMKNVKLLAGRGCYAQNCSSAKKLGVEAWKLGARYWGYKDIYFFTLDEKEYFKEFNNYGIKLIIDGIPWRKAYEMVKQLADKLVDKLVKAGKALAAACLRHNADSLVLYDEENPPETRCIFRKAVIKLLGPIIGWRISRKFAISFITFGGGIALYIHDRICEWVKLESRLHGIDVGFALLVASFIIISYDLVKWLKKI